MQEKPTKTAAAVSHAASNALCQACGLCCRGIWFSHVKLDDKEVAQAQRIGLPVEVSDGSAGFQQSCVLHNGTGCTAYQTWRPRRCVEYRCLLLNQLDAGEVSFEDALRHVTEARAMADRVQGEAGLLPGGLLGKAFQDRLMGDDAGNNQDVKALTPLTKLDAVALRVYFEKHFRNAPPPAEKDL